MTIFRYVGLEGLSTLPDIHLELNKKGILLGETTLKRATFDLADRGMLKRQVVHIYKGGKITLVSLTADGKSFAADELQQEIIESDWERLEQFHEGDRFPRHTASVLAFAYHARLRDWVVDVMPDDDLGQAVPDVWVSKDGKEYFVEVEVMGKGSSRKRKRKWELSYQLQGKVAVCTPDPKRRQVAVDEIRERHFPGVATDLTTLARNEHSDCPLWQEDWVW